ncbi:MAG: nuclear transport factor 2 family protein [Gemmatimonadota bacterium]
MHRGLRSALLLAFLTVPAVSRAQKASSSPDEAAVRQVVTTYLHGLKFNDVPSLEKAFWPDAKLFFVGTGGHLGQLSQAEWYKGFATSAGKEEEGDLKIVSVEVTRDIANVKVVEEYPTSRYTDYIALIRFDGAWRIVNKIYTAEKKPKK